MKSETCFFAIKSQIVICCWLMRRRSTQFQSPGRSSLAAHTLSSGASNLVEILINGIVLLPRISSRLIAANLLSIAANVIRRHSPLIYWQQQRGVELIGGRRTSLNYLWDDGDDTLERWMQSAPVESPNIAVVLLLPLLISVPPPPQMITILSPCPVTSHHHQLLIAGRWVGRVSIFSVSQESNLYYAYLRLLSSFSLFL